MKINKKIILFISVFIGCVLVGFVVLRSNLGLFIFIKQMILQDKYGSIISEGRKIDNNYLEYKGNIYKYTSGSEFYDLSQAITSDVTNFQSLDGLYAKDSTNYYYNSKKINNIDYDSFEILSDEYAKDKLKVYFSGEVLPNSDPKDFEYVDEKKNLTRSGNSIYIQEKLVPNIDANKFEYLEKSSFFKDDNTLIQFNSYIDGRGSKHTDNSYFKEISGIDVSKFKILDDASQYRRVGYDYVPVNCGDGTITLDCITGKKIK